MIARSMAKSSLSYSRYSIRRRVFTFAAAAVLLLVIVYGASWATLVAKGRWDSLTHPDYKNFRVDVWTPNDVYYRPGIHGLFRPIEKVDRWVRPDFWYKGFNVDSLPINIPSFKIDGIEIVPAQQAKLAEEVIEKQKSTP
jgi:hypothetical protein